MRAPLTTPQWGFLGLVGGGLFLPYAITKARLAGAVVDREWSTPVTTTADTALAVHLFEAVLVSLLFVGVLAYAASRRREIGTVGLVGVVIATVGVVALTVTHVGEHTLHSPPITGLPGEGGVFVYGYLLSWAVIEWGESLLGLAAMRAEGHVTSASGTLATSLPIAVGVGLLAVATGTYTLAGVHRLVQAGLGIIVGRSLLTGNAERSTQDAPVRS